MARWISVVLGGLLGLAFGASGVVGLGALVLLDVSLPGLVLLLLRSFLRVMIGGTHLYVSAILLARGPNPRLLMMGVGAAGLGTTVLTFDAWKQFGSYGAIVGGLWALLAALQALHLVVLRGLGPVPESQWELAMLEDADND